MTHRSPSTKQARRRHWMFAAAAVTLFSAVGAVCLLGASRGRGPAALGRVELDVKSQFSHIRVRRNGPVRTMAFVRDSGHEALETQVDLTQPHELQFTYLKCMFLSYALKPDQSRVLVVGLGGGSMVHFMNRYDPQTDVDAVEIDPVVVRIADEYFGVRNKRNVKIVTADGFDFIANSTSRYDVIYMDAFLKPMQGTDSTGVPLKLRTLQFYRQLQERLTPGGLVVYNLNPHAKVDQDIQTIREAFPQTYVFSLPSRHGYVAIGSMSPQRLSERELARRGRLIDRRLRTSFSFEEMARWLK